MLEGGHNFIVRHYWPVLVFYHKWNLKVILRRLILALKCLLTENDDSPETRKYSACCASFTTVFVFGLTWKVILHRLILALVMFSDWEWWFSETRKYSACCASFITVFVFGLAWKVILQRLILALKCLVIENDDIWNWVVQLSTDSETNSKPRRGGRFK